jgi:hypothetical protein
MALEDKFASVESGGNVYAKNPRSSAYGPHQFIASTWLAMLRKHRPDLVQGRSVPEQLALRSNQAISSEMSRAYSAANADYLRAKGFEPNDENLYLAHFAGPKGAADLLANPNAPASSILSRDAIEANPFLKDWSAGDVAKWAGGKMNSSAPGASVPASTADASPSAPRAANKGNDAVLPMLAQLFAGSGGGAGGLAGLFQGGDLEGLGNLFNSAPSTSSPAAGALAAAGHAPAPGGPGAGGLLGDFLNQGGSNAGLELAQQGQQQAAPAQPGWLPRKPVDMRGLQAMLARRPQLGMGAY